MSICYNITKKDGDIIMMYPYMTLTDGTGVAHSEIYTENGSETVKVYFEKPIFGGFKSAECYLPSYDWKNIEGFTKEEIENLQEYLESVSHIIIELAKDGGFEDASNF